MQSGEKLAFYVHGYIGEVLCGWIPRACKDRLVTFLLENRRCLHRAGLLAGDGQEEEWEQTPTPGNP